MANAFTYAPVPTGSQLPIVRSVGMIPFSMAGGATYATATGGLPVSAAELADVIAGAGIESQVKVGDIIAIRGNTTLGHLGVWTKQSDNSWKVKLWNGTTEIADGAYSGTIKGEIIFSPGSPS